MKGCLRIVLWFFAWPILLPIWLWGKGIIGKGLAVVFVLLVVVVGSVATSPKSNKETVSSNSSITRAMPTFTPTSLPVAVIDTPVPAAVLPTDTPVPTAALPTDTPVPTATSVTGFSGEVLGYVSEMTRLGNQIGDALVDMGELLQTPRIGNDAWTISVAADLVIIQQSHKALSEMSVPAEMAQVHAALLAGTSRCDEATHLIISGMDNLNADDLNLAAAKLNECTAGVQAASQQFAAYASGVGVPQPTPQTRVNSEANLRGGPGTEFVVVGAVVAGQAVEIVGRNEAGDWYQLRDGAWIAAFLVDGVPDGLPVVGR